MSDTPSASGTTSMRRVLLTLLEAAVLALAVTTFVVSTVVIDGASMTPALADGDRVLVPKYETWLYRLGFGSFGRGDVVYFPDPLAQGSFRPHLIKRIVAVGGEVVELRDGVLYVDGVERAEPYLPERWRVPANAGPLEVPSNHVWVLGDNRSPLGSVDSRRFGPVPVGDIRGRAAVVLWPPQRVHAVGAGGAHPAFGP